MAESSVIPLHRLEVDLRTPLKPVDRAASGSLYGLAGEQRPPRALLDPLRPKMFTQMAPRGGQLPNGETAPAGDVLDVAGIAAASGAAVTVRMPDSFETFPYQWSSWPDWLDRVRRQVRDVQRAGVTNIYAYELWNEPNWTWQPDLAGPFAAGWDRTFAEVRLLDATTPIMGPSIDRWSREWMVEFLTGALAAGTFPDIVSWHELDPADSFELVEHVAAYREVERALGVEPRPISINEYGAHRDMGDPGALTRFVAMIERAGVDTANIAFWHRPGRLADLVTAAGEPTGAWWLYRWYGEMTGSMVAATASAGPDRPDLFASHDAGVRSARIVIGGGAGDMIVRVRGAAAVANTEGLVTVDVVSTMWTGTDGPMHEPRARFYAVHDVVDDVLTIPLCDVRADEALLIVLTAASGSPSRRTGPRYEAQEATITGGMIRRDDLASAGRYVELPPDDDAGVRFAVTVDGAGPYDVFMRLATGGTMPIEATVLLNGAATRVALGVGVPEDGFSTRRVTVVLPAGRSELGVLDFTTEVRLDHIDVLPFRRRYEAEDGRITRGSVERVDMRRSAFRSNTFSGAAFVSWLNEIDSAVELDVNVPAGGRYIAVIGYTNASVDGAQQGLVIDGEPRGAVTYPLTQGPELVGTVTVEMTLAAGGHVLRLEKGALPGHVCLDFVDVVAQVSGYLSESASGTLFR